MTDKMATPKHSSPAVPMWPRLTPAQKEMLLYLENGKEGYFSGGASMRTVYCLLENAMIRRTNIMWFEITQRGKDYLRFGMRRKKS